MGWLVRRYERAWVHSDPLAVTGDEGQRPCACGAWCDSAEVTVLADGTTRRDPALGYRPFCDRDTRHIARALDDLPGQYERLGTEIGNPARRGQLVRVPFGPSIPLRGDVDALMRYIAPVLAGWAARVRLALQHHQPDPRRRIITLPAVEDAAGLLAANLGPLLALPPGWTTRTFALHPGRHGAPALIDPGLAELLADCEIVRIGVDFVTVLTRLDGANAGLELLDLHALARRMLGDTKPAPERLLGVPCRRQGCDLRALRRATLPPWWSECGACGDRMTEDEYRAWVRRCAVHERSIRRVPVLENLPGHA